MNADRDLVITRDIAVPPEKMGFAERWGVCTGQLAERAAAL